MLVADNAFASFRDEETGGGKSLDLKTPPLGKDAG